MRIFILLAISIMAMGYYPGYEVEHAGYYGAGHTGYYGAELPSPCQDYCPAETVYFGKAAVCARHECRGCRFCFEIEPTYGSPAYGSTLLGNPNGCE